MNNEYNQFSNLNFNNNMGVAENDNNIIKSQENFNIQQDIVTNYNIPGGPAPKNNLPIKRIILIVTSIIVGLLVIFSLIFLNNKNKENNESPKINSNTKKNKLEIYVYDKLPRYEINFPQNWKLYNAEQFEKKYDIESHRDVKYILISENVRIEFVVGSGNIKEINDTNCSSFNYGYIQNINKYDLTDDISLYTMMDFEEDYSNESENRVLLNMSVGYNSFYDYIKTTEGINENGYLINNKKTYFCSGGKGLNIDTSFEKNSSVMIYVLYNDYYTRYNGGATHQIVYNKDINELRNEISNDKEIKEAIEILRTIKYFK